MTDQLYDTPTGLWNRSGLLFFAEHYLKFLRRVKRESILLVIGLDGCRADGPVTPSDEVPLKEAIRLLRCTFRTSDAIARVEPGLFAVLLMETSELGAELLLRRLEDRLAEWKQAHPDVSPLTLSLVVDRVRADQDMTFADALERIVAAFRRRETAKTDRRDSSPMGDWAPDAALPTG